MPYTRAGCDFGSVAAADTELENTLPDIPDVFGANSAAAKEAENPKLANKAEADYMGLSVHCAQGSSICDAAHGGVTDLLPDEPERVQRVPGAVRRQVHPAGDQPVRRRYAT